MIRPAGRVVLVSVSCSALSGRMPRWVATILNFASSVVGRCVISLVKPNSMLTWPDCPLARLLCSRMALAGAQNGSSVVVPVAASAELPPQPLASL